MDIKDYKLLCHKGSGKYNEDIVGINKSGAWVLDGSTGLNNKNFISSKTDAAWYVSWWDKYLQENLEKEKSLDKIVLEGVKKIKEEFLSDLKNIKVGKIDMPSASIAIIRFYEGEIEYFILGDCTLLIRDKNQQRIIKDDRVCKYDDIIFKSMDKLNKKGNLTVKEKRNLLLPHIIDNRLKKNTKEGYWILEFDTEAVKNALYGHLHMKDELEIVMSSDGFSCAFDRYKIFEENEIIEIARNKGIEYINEKIRKLEREDNKGIDFPRFKESDDSSCVYLHIIKR